jgi:hypothetical protein
LPDTVSTPRAMAIKIMGVTGEHVPESTEDDSQDFLMVNGPAFVHPGPKGFLKDSKLLALTTEKSTLAKTIVSAVLRGTEAVIEAVGGESAKIKNMGGHPKSHPLGATYFTQVPFLFGPYMGKFSLAPVSPALTALTDRTLETEGDDAQRQAVIDFFASQADTPAQWELRVQLCTCIEKMPREDSSIAWDEALSPYVTVAALTIPAQQAWNTPESENLEDRIAFDPWHAIRPPATRRSEPGAPPGDGRVARVPFRIQPMSDSFSRFRGAIRGLNTVG